MEDEGRSRWEQKTDAEILSVEGLWRWKAEEGGRFLLGVMGFAGAWHRTGLAGEALEAYISAMSALIEAELAEHQRAHGARLAVVSGATDLGVLRLAYRLCMARGICGVGIAPSAVLRYTLAPMQVVVPVGARFGDESEVFVGACDAFLLVGGGAQSARETRMARALGRPITIIQGFGGTADALTPLEFPEARWVQRPPLL